MVSRREDAVLPACEDALTADEYAALSKIRTGVSEAARRRWFTGRPELTQRLVERRLLLPLDPHMALTDAGLAARAAYTRRNFRLDTEQRYVLRQFTDDADYRVPRQTFYARRHRALNRLVSLGLLDRRKTELGRRAYRITPAGRAALGR